eukprot:scaffold17988_cov136-Isochrysis_galbana.AAC.6
MRLADRLRLVAREHEPVAHRHHVECRVIKLREILHVQLGEARVGQAGHSGLRLGQHIPGDVRRPDGRLGQFPSDGGRRLARACRKVEDGRLLARRHGLAHGC